MKNMPMDRSRYPRDWAKIAYRVKRAAKWKCEACGKQCKRPSEKHATHTVTLTTAHMNHTPEDNRRENLRALCAPCHLRYDTRTGREFEAHNWVDVCDPNYAANL